MESLTYTYEYNQCSMGYMKYEKWFHWRRLVYRSRLMLSTLSLQAITKCVQCTVHWLGSHGPISIAPGRLAHSEISFHSFITFFVPLYFLPKRWRCQTGCARVCAFISVYCFVVGFCDCYCPFKCRLIDFVVCLCLAYSLPSLSLSPILFVIWEPRPKRECWSKLGFIVPPFPRGEESIHFGGVSFSESAVSSSALFLWAHLRSGEATKI